MGQGGVGKTAMVLRWTNGEFNEEYMPTIGDMYTKDLEVGGQPKHVEIDDTAGQVRLISMFAMHCASVLVSAAIATHAKPLPFLSIFSVFFPSIGGIR